MMKIGRTNYFSVHRAFPNRTWRSLCERITNTIWAVCSWDCVSESLGYSRIARGLVRWKVHLQLCKHQLSLCLSPLATDASSSPDHKFPYQPRCQGRFAMVLPAVFRNSPVFCMDVLARLMLPGICIHNSSLPSGPKYELREATGLTAG